MTFIRSTTLALVSGILLGLTTFTSAKQPQTDEQRQARHEAMKRRQIKMQVQRQRAQRQAKGNDSDADKQQSKKKESKSDTAKKKGETRDDRRRTAKAKKRQGRKGYDDNEREYRGGRGYRPAVPFGWGPAFGLSIVTTPAYDDDRIYRGRPIEVSVQIELAERGYYRGPIDGLVGRGTQSAIYRYQIRNGLPATGTIDRPLLRSLGLR